MSAEDKPFIIMNPNHIILKSKLSYRSTHALNVFQFNLQCNLFNTGLLKCKSIYLTESLWRKYILSIILSNICFLNKKYSLRYSDIKQASLALLVTLKSNQQTTMFQKPNFKDASNSWRIQRSHKIQRKYGINIVRPRNITVASLGKDPDIGNSSSLTEFQGKIFSKETFTSTPGKFSKNVKFNYVRWIIFLACFIAVFFQVTLKKKE